MPTLIQKDAIIRAFFHTYPDVVYLLLQAKKRLQELFEKYDVSGDGVLSEEVPNLMFFSFGAVDDR